VFCVSVKVKRSLLFCYYVFVCIPPGKAVPEMTYTVSGGTLNPTHSLTHSLTYRIRLHDIRQCHVIYLQDAQDVYLEQECDRSLTVKLLTL